MSQIDIVIPVYNQSKRIIECLKSLQQQTFQDFSVIIVDDGSTDNVKNILEAWLRAENLRAKDYKSELSTKTKIITQNNQGAPSARNRGSREGNAEYILFCDADATLHKNFLNKTLQKLIQNKNKSYCYTSFKYGWKKFKLWEFDAEKLKQMPFIHTTSLIRRECFPGFDESIKRLQDWDLWLTMLEKGYTGIWIPEYLFSVHPGGTMSKWVPKIFVRYFTASKRVHSYLEAVEKIKTKHHLK